MAAASMMPFAPARAPSVEELGRWLAEWEQRVRAVERQLEPDGTVATG